MIVKHIAEAMTAGARQGAACDLLALDPRTLQRWSTIGGGDDFRRGPNTVPKNKLTDREQERLLETANSPEFRDLSPKQIVPTLASRAVYFASESTFYRLLRVTNQLKHRGSTWSSIQPGRQKKA